MKCSLVYMDFEGRSDGRSVKSVIAHVAPLKLVCEFNYIYFFYLCALDFSGLTKACSFMGHIAHLVYTSPYLTP